WHGNRVLDGEPQVAESAAVAGALAAIHRADGCAGGRLLHVESDVGRIHAPACSLLGTYLHAIVGRLHDRDVTDNVFHDEQPAVWNAAAPHAETVGIRVALRVRS